MHNESHNSIALSQFSLEDVLAGVASIVADKLKAFKEQQQEEKLLSPAETCKLFQPAISKPTLQVWDRQGFLKSYRFGGRVFYKYSEIMEAGKNLKRYKKVKAEPLNSH